jgi:hypothetical protein
VKGKGGTQWGSCGMREGRWVCIVVGKVQVSTVSGSIQVMDGIHVMERIKSRSVSRTPDSCSITILL